MAFQPLPIGSVRLSPNLQSSIFCPSGARFAGGDGIDGVCEAEGEGGW